MQLDSPLKPHSQDKTNTSSLWLSAKPMLLPTPALDFADEQTARHCLREYFLNTFDTYEQLFECLKHEDAFFIKPITLRHPLIFYFAHTATFFVNKLLLSKLISERLNPHFESIFAIGVDEMSWDDLDEVHYDWPTVQEVRDYRHQVRALILNILENAPLTLPLNWQNPWWTLIMGIEHERIHLETSSVLIRQHALEYVRQHPQWRANLITGMAPDNHLLEVPDGKVLLQKDFNDPFYGWDNEYGQHEADVTAFAASKYLVSNQEFLAFVEADGYQTEHYWNKEGLGWLQFSQATHPCFWRKTELGWSLRLMLEEVPMPWDWPVEVNYHEAKAFCQWKSQQLGKTIRLPTEDEWYRLYAVSDLDPDLQSPEQANIELKYGTSSCPVDHFKQGDFYDIQGNVWQWTETPIYPFQGFQVHPFYDDFSTPTFDGRHNLMKGGSWISAGNEALYSSRYAFRRHFFQHAGFRYVASDQALQNFPSNYESDQLVSQYLEFQYGTEYFGVANFAKTLVTLAQSYFQQTLCHRALDIGCATGRASFELARHFDQVTGLDFSARFIQQAVYLAQGHRVRYQLPLEGELSEEKSCSLEDVALDQLASKTEFFQADACNLKAHFSGYDFILAANLIDRLHHPKDFLLQIHKRINIGGILMLSSPYTWLEEHTARSEWLGGFQQDGEKITTLAGISNILTQHFELVAEPQDVPFVIRETARKYQHTLSQVTIWKRVR
ncbi:5-histidylcysteine sulfoxide synthase [Acinetobacter lwoffii]|uniref:5-histidylcysteine sulfoxide synthase n=1 Tax=Acinetobacter lwoffii TaxID=28090 RepID=A0AAW8AQ13_ACILW|nr:5-histidylcysteine sulfoxide synthase [Acinetobacter lwoffii]MDP1318144.1 5-histidylcysteine sulfoxide synthase [Acinetobacter lwoffii]MDP1369524.1 5-histidylcysteine sulfoxide synthase [Acinetobacter lwoffii]MDP1389920.1 5-histidylcysteine sulfoxide synthase [Acinetobacter lwoffii]MDP1446634.1 5-histidylcysteine sulfoxide synthase [Acinetobacter lwoffii]